MNGIDRSLVAWVVLTGRLCFEVKTQLELKRVMLKKIFRLLIDE